MMKSERDGEGRESGKGRGFVDGCGCEGVEEVTGMEDEGSWLAGCERSEREGSAVRTEEGGSSSSSSGLRSSARWKWSSFRSRPRAYRGFH